MFFTPNSLRGTNSKTTNFLLAAIFFRLNTLKGTAVDLVSLNTLRATKTAFSTPKRYDKHARCFYMGVPPGGKLEHPE